jgi:tetratricopeptide (TPR) repeat protein
VIPAPPLVEADASQHLSSVTVANEQLVVDDVASEPAGELGAVLAALRMQALVLPPMPAAAEETNGTDGLDSVFDAMRARVTDAQDTAGQRYERGQQHLRAGRLAEGLGELHVAAMTPALRFAAASSIGRALASLGEYKDAVEWMERAAEAPPPSIEEGWTLLSDLADALECLGERDRALAMLEELQVVDGDRDFTDRIERLRGVPQGSPRA